MLQFPIEALSSRIHTAPDRVPEEWLRVLSCSAAGEFNFEMFIAECAAKKTIRVDTCKANKWHVRIFRSKL
jgi:hypothetical protein